MRFEAPPRSPFFHPFANLRANSRWWFFSLTALGCLVAATASVAQPAPRETFEDQTQVTLIEVPVHVTDRDGNPVRGLVAEDFELWDGGKKQTIHGLEAVDLQLLQANRVQVERVARSLPTSSRRHFLLLFDFTFSSPNAVVRAREAAREFVLNQLHGTDLAAVATFSLEQGPRLLVTFTSDRGQLARAVDTLGISQLVQRGTVDPLRFFYDGPESFGSSEDDLAIERGGAEGLENAMGEHLKSLALDREKAQRNYERNRISQWAHSLAELAKGIGAMQGRKHIVLFSGGFDGSLAFGRDGSRDSEEMRNEQALKERGQFWLVDQDNTFGNPALQNALRDMIEEFRRADCTIEAVDLGGLRTEVNLNNMQRNTESSGIRNRTDSLFYLADSTGGNLFEQSNDLSEKLGDMLERSSVTYVLSFYPSDLKNDGEFHRLKVKLKDKTGLRLKHRAGFYAERPFKDLHPLEKSLLASEALTSTRPRQEIDIALLTAPFRASDKHAYVPVVVEIDGESLLRGHADPKLGVELYVYASTLQGVMRDFRTQLINIDLTKQRSLIERGIKYYGHFDLAPGDYTIRVLVRNGQNGRTSVTSQNLEIPEYQEKSPGLLQPIFVEQSADWFLVRERLAQKDATDFVYPFVAKGEPFIPAALPRVRSGEKAPLYLIAQDFGKGPIEIEGTVLGTEGLAHSEGQLDLVDRTSSTLGGTDKLLATFDPQDLRPGTYTLEVAVRNTANGNQRKTTTTLVVDAATPVSTSTSSASLTSTTGDR